MQAYRKVIRGIICIRIERDEISSPLGRRVESEVNFFFIGVPVFDKDTHLPVTASLGPQPDHEQCGIALVHLDDISCAIAGIPLIGARTVDHDPDLPGE